MVAHYSYALDISGGGCYHIIVIILSLILIYYENLQKKGFAPVALIVILVILAGGGYILVKKLKVDSSKQEAKGEQNVTTETQTSSTKQENQSVAGETKDWKTYRNEKYGFEFKYPSNSNVAIAADLVRCPGASTGDVCLAQVDVVGIPSKISVLLFGQDSLANAFKNQYEKQSYFHPYNLDTRELSGLNLITLKRGCYECYDGDSRIGTEDIISLVCNTKGDVCVRISTSDISENKFGVLESFFVKEFLPTFRIDKNLFDNIRYQRSNG